MAKRHIELHVDKSFCKFQDVPIDNFHVLMNDGLPGIYWEIDEDFPKT